MATVVLAGALTACTYAGATATSGPPMGSGRWSVDFRDTFSGTSLHGASWTTCYWWDRGGCTNLGNDEDQWYLPSQVSTRGGVLRLRAEPATSRHLDRSFGYRSGMVTTGRTGDDPEAAARYAFTYGYVEVRFRTPRGAGLWPAIWLLPATNSSLPEIDLLEQYGDDTRLSSMTLHGRAPGEPRRDRRDIRSDDLSVGWHTVGLEWTKGRLRWFLDGQQRFEVVGDRVPSQPMYLIANLAVGGNGRAVGADTAFPATFAIDEVTVWKQR